MSEEISNCLSECCKNLESSEFKVLFSLCRKINKDTGECCPTVAEICKETGLTQKYVIGL